MEEDIKVRTIYRIDNGILQGTEIEPFMFMLCVKYPHRKTKDVYIPPSKDKNIETWHCCQDNCPEPDFTGDFKEFIKHLMIHKGRLMKPWNKRNQLKSPIPAIKLPPNPWNGRNEGVNEDRRFVVKLYIDSIEAYLRKQGLEIIKDDKH